MVTVRRQRERNGGARLAFSSSRVSAAGPCKGAADIKVDLLSSVKPFWKCLPMLPEACLLDNSKFHKARPCQAKKKREDGREDGDVSTLTLDSIPVTTAYTVKASFPSGRSTQPLEGVLKADSLLSIYSL